MRIVLIHWQDSSTKSDWTVKEDFKDWTMDDLACQTVGFVQQETDELICVVQNISAEQIGEQMTIPKFAIQKIVELGDSTRRR